MFSILAFIIGAIGWRIRGGALKDFKVPDYLKTTSAGRYIWAVIVGLFFLVMTGEWAYTPSVMLMAYLGLLHGYFGEFDLWQKENRSVKNYAKLTAASMLRIAPLCVAFILTEYRDAFAYGMFAAALFVPAYLIGNYVYKWYPKLGHTQYGEALIGGIILTAISWGL